MISIDIPLKTNYNFHFNFFNYIHLINKSINKPIKDPATIPYPSPLLKTVLKHAAEKNILLSYLHTY